MKSPLNIICSHRSRKLPYIFIAICCFSWAMLGTFSTGPTPLPLGFPPDLTKISLLTETDVCATNAGQRQIEIVFLVLSHADNVWKRQVIRSVYPRADIERVGIRRAFVVSRIDHAPDIKGNSKVMEENARYSDLLLLDLAETYDALTYKSLTALKWAAVSCKSARFIIKTDDDMLINYYQVLQEFQSLQDYENTLFGALHSHSQVSRSTGWHFYVSYQEYAVDFYPPYLGGLFYACTPSTALALVEASKRVPFFKFEDVYVTGFLAMEAAVRLVGLNSKIIFESNKTLNCCHNDSKGVMYDCQFFISSIDRNKIGDYEAMLSKVRDHGSICYFNQNCVKNGRISMLYNKWTSKEFKCF